MKSRARVSERVFTFPRSDIEPNMKTHVRSHEDVMREYGELPQAAKARVWGHLQDRGTLGTTDPDEIAAALLYAKEGAADQKARMQEIGERIANGYGVPSHIMEPEKKPPTKTYTNGQWFATNGSQDPALWTPLSRDYRPPINEPPQSPESQPWPPQPRNEREARALIERETRRQLYDAITPQQQSLQRPSPNVWAERMKAGYRVDRPDPMLETCRHGLPLHAGEVYRCGLCESQRAGRWPKEANVEERGRRFRGMPR